jgi:hypothetical protein
MRTYQLFAAMLALVIRCCLREPESPNLKSQASPVREGLAAQIKAQTSSGIDGGAAAMAAASHPRWSQPPTITYTVDGDADPDRTGHGDHDRNQSRYQYHHLDWKQDDHGHGYQDRHANDNGGPRPIPP